MDAHENVINFKKGKNVKEIIFKLADGDDNHVVSPDQPWGGLTCVQVGDTTRIGIVAGRHGTEKCAVWFKNSVGDSYDRMIHTMGGDNQPKKLNFAVKGTLTIDGDTYNVCLGQGHTETNNNWHLASAEVLADGDAKSGTIGNRYRLEQDGVNGFKVSTSI